VNRHAHGGRPAILTRPYRKSPPGLPAQLPGARHSGVNPLLLAILFCTLLAGRLSLSRWGLDSAEDMELRIPLLAGVVLIFLAWRVTLRPHRASRWPTAMRMVVLHIGVLMLAGLWADPHARVWTAALDLLALLTLVIVAMSASQCHPERAALQFVVMLYGAGISYALIGLLAGSFSTHGRLTALSGGPNVFVRIVLLGLLASIVLAVRDRQVWYLAPVPLLAYAALLSGSRGGLISAIVTGLFALLYYARRFRPRHVLGGTALMLGTLYLLAGFGAEQRLGWVQRRYSMDLLADNRFASRPELIRQALRIFAEHPYTGGGLDSFAATYSPGQSGAYAHNYLASVAADTGLIGLVVLALALVAVLVATMRRLRKASAAQVGLLFGALFIMIASNFSGDYYDSRLAWVFFGIALANRQEVRSQ
jgi:O-antigen ligase